MRPSNNKSKGDHGYGKTCRSHGVLNIRKQYLPLAEIIFMKVMKEVMDMSKNDQEFLVQKIRTQYTEKQHTELDALKELDARVKRPANVFAYAYGSVSAIIMGAGMSLVMTEIGAAIGLASTMAPGIVIGILGMGMALSTYPIYKKILDGRKAEYRDEIFALSDKISK